VVVTAGDTEVEPVRATSPIPWLIITVEASVTTQLKPTLSPSLIVVESAVNDVITGFAGVTPPHPYINTNKKITK